jgi:hypothetical protein
MRAQPKYFAAADRDYFDWAPWYRPRGRICGARSYGIRYSATHSGNAQRQTPSRASKETG